MDVPEIQNVLVENFRGIEPLNFRIGVAESATLTRWTARPTVASPRPE